MIELAGQPAEIRFTLEIKRAATGLTETVEMVGMLDADKLKALQDDAMKQGVEDVGITLDGGA